MKLYIAAGQEGSGGGGGGGKSYQDMSDSDSGHGSSVSTTNPTMGSSTTSLNSASSYNLNASTPLGPPPPEDNPEQFWGSQATKGAVGDGNWNVSGKE